MTSWVVAIIAFLVIGGVVALVINIIRAKPVAYCPHCGKRLDYNGRGAYICHLCEAAWSDDDDDDNYLWRNDLWRNDDEDDDYVWSLVE